MVPMLPPAFQSQVNIMLQAAQDLSSPTFKLTRQVSTPGEMCPSAASTEVDEEILRLEAEEARIRGMKEKLRQSRATGRS
jgi:hypothetical protein